MSLPSAAAPTNHSSRAQMSIKSFFQPRQPNYAPAPGQTKPRTENGRPEQGLPPLPPVPLAAPRRPVQTSPPPATEAPMAPLVPTRTTVSSSFPSSTSPSPPPQASIRAVAQRDVQALRRINALLLPVNYPDAFYQGVVDPAGSGPFSRVILWADDAAAAVEPKVVGGVVCRIDPVAPEAATTTSGGAPEHALYIQSLCLLSPYRRFGLATAALDDVVAAATASPRLNVRHVYAHVWTENDDGLQWYQARGFRRDPLPVQDYYMKLRPGSAWIVRRSAVLPAIRGSLAAAAATAPTPAAAAAERDAMADHARSTAADAARPTRATPGPAPLSRVDSDQSYQNRRADMEWNDLPADMAPGLLALPRSNGGSGASSRSSSTARKKKDRAYPTAAFGG